MKSDVSNIEQLFGEALDAESPDELERFLSRLDRPARTSVEELLSSHHGVGRFLGAESNPTAVEREHDGFEAKTIGPYKIREQIGEGGFGVVFVAEQSEPIQRKVALKVIKPGMDSKDVIARFEGERQALALMDHPNVARVLDAGTTEAGHPYFVMELVRGVKITEFCDEEKLNANDRLNLFIDVCRAVQHAHQKGIIHRDLKPANVLVTLHDGKPVPKVIDFGVAKALSQKLTERTIYTSIGQMIGTPMYMSPEQAEVSGIDVDTRSDVYSLGVLLYELLTGATPFDKEQLKRASFDELRRIIRDDEPIKPSARISTLVNGLQSTISDQRQIDVKRLTSSLKGDLDWVVMKALSKARDRRYDSPADLAADITRYLDQQPVEASPPSQLYRAKKYITRHRLALTATTLVAASLITGTGFSMRYAFLAQAAREQAESSESLAKDRLNLLEKEQRKLKTEQQKLQAEKLKLSDSQQESERHFTLAKEAVAKLIDEIASRKLVAFPELADFRETLLDTADGFYTQLLDENPEDHLLLIARADVRERLRRSEDAYEDYARSAELAPDSSLAHRKLAEFFRNTPQLKLRNADSARDHAQRAVDLSPDDPKAWFTLAWVCNQHFPELRRQAAEAFLRVSELESEPAAKALHRADSFRVLGNYEEAIVSYSQAIDSDYVKSYHPYSIRGTCYAALHDYELAIRDYTRAIDINAFAYETYRRRAHAWMALKDYKKATADWETSHALATNLKPEYTGLLQCYLKSEAWEQAARLLENRSGDETSFANLINSSSNQIIDSSRNQRLQTARDQFLNSLIDSLKVERNFPELSWLLWKIDRIEESIAAFEVALEEAPDPTTINNFAWLLATVSDKSLRNPLKAIELVEASIVGTTGRLAQQQWNTLGAASYDAGRFEDAIAALTTAQDAYDDGQGPNPYGGFILAMAHWQLGNQDEAKTCLELAENGLANHTSNDTQLLRLREQARQLITEPDAIAVPKRSRTEN